VSIIGILRICQHGRRMPHSLLSSMSWRHPPFVPALSPEEKCPVVSVHTHSHKHLCVYVCVCIHIYIYIHIHEHNPHKVDSFIRAVAYVVREIGQRLPDGTMILCTAFSLWLSHVFTTFFVRTCSDCLLVRNPAGHVVRHMQRSTIWYVRVCAEQEQPGLVIRLLSASSVVHVYVLVPRMLCSGSKTPATPVCSMLCFACTHWKDRRVPVPHMASLVPEHAHAHVHANE
jgi:hypothetical protein